MPPVRIDACQVSHSHDRLFLLIIAISREGDLVSVEKHTNCTDCERRPTTEWNCLTAGELRVLDNSKIDHVLAVGETIYNQGEGCNGVYCIRSGLIGLRREKALYISMWYYVATFLGVAMLYLFNNMEIPTMLLSGNLGAWYHSVSMYAGTNDAMVQWWWGHNAVAFVFTVPIIALIYYYLPKESGQAVFSYKLSLLSFWGLMFIYLWAGGHHLLWSTVPDWVQTMASIFSVILILPSWGSAINMLLTMKGEWNQLTDNPLIKFMILASTFYMLSTLEGPIQAVKSVNAIAHFTDWIPGHVHDGVLGWVAFMVFATLMHSAPRVFKREIYSKSLLEAQFWIQTVAVVLYFTSMWIAGITQGMMWRAVDEYGNLMYSFIDTVNVLHPYWVIRAVGGTLYFIGLLMFAWNFFMTATAGRKLETEPQFRSPMA